MTNKANLTADFLIRICGRGKFQILSIGPAEIGGNIGTRYAVKVRDETFEGSYEGTWSVRENLFRYDFTLWYLWHFRQDVCQKRTPHGELVEVELNLAA